MWYHYSMWTLSIAEVDADYFSLREFSSRITRKVCIFLSLSVFSSGVKDFFLFVFTLISPLITSGISESGIRVICSLPLILFLYNFIYQCFNHLSQYPNFPITYQLQYPLWQPVPLLTSSTSIIFLSCRHTNIVINMHVLKTSSIRHNYVHIYSSNRYQIIYDRFDR